MQHTPKIPVLNRLVCLVLLAVLCLTATGAAAAQGGNRIIVRDEEIEDFLKTWSTPVIRSAGLDPDAVNIILIQDDNMNAFVAGGQNIFLNTGLIAKSENPGEIVGVIAHELGHIRGGHLVRTRGALENASYESLIGAVIGIGAAILTGHGGAAAAISAGSQATALNKFLAFSRIQESSADQAALQYMETAKLNPRGLMTFMQKLEDQELLPPSQQSAYVRTHPLTRDRVEALRGGWDRSSYKDSAFPAAWQDQHARMTAKLVGFTNPAQVAWHYRDNDTSIPARYARAIAAYRLNQVEDALRMTDGLLRNEPDNPFFLELMGQMLADFGRVADAVPYYKRAIDIKPDAPLIRTAYAHTLIETAGDNDAHIQDAIKNLQRAAREEPRSTRIHRLLATAYGRLGKESMAKLHLAEEALLERRLDDARALAEAAREGLEPGTSERLQAEDVLAAIDQSPENDGDQED